MLPPAQIRQGLIVAHRQALTSNVLRVSATTLLRTSLASTQPRRSFWGWRRPSDWSSHLDPLYHRFARIRTLKTRARLLKNLRRRGKFQWDDSAADFFTPKHVRWATRWDGPGRGGRRPWWTTYFEEEGSSKSGKRNVEKAEDGEDGGYELSKREKEWKEQMEAMRKRIESDPYEAIFGKRFEPFWSPLVPSWMREEMGLPVWKEKGKEAGKPVEAASKEAPVREETKVPSQEDFVDKVMGKIDKDLLEHSRNIRKGFVEGLKDQAKKDSGEVKTTSPDEKAKTSNLKDGAEPKSSPVSTKSDVATKRAVTASNEQNGSVSPENWNDMMRTYRKPEAWKVPDKPNSANEQDAKSKTITPEVAAEQKSASSSYAYASSTLWDSWSNKTRRAEWDSVSGTTKNYEYDPISNRMILVEPPKPAEMKSVEIKPETSRASTTPSIKATEVRSHALRKSLRKEVPASKSGLEVKQSDDAAVNIPVKQSTDVRKSIPIPPPLSQPSFSIPIIGFPPMPTALGPWKSTAIAPEVVKNTALASDVPKPSALAKLPEKEAEQEQVKKKTQEGLESLTADEVRANMGKIRQPSVGQSPSVQTQVDALLSERSIRPLPKVESSASKPTSEWDKAELSVMYDKELENLYKKKEKLLKDERGLFHIERQKRELIKLDQRIKELVRRVEKLNEQAAPTSKPASPGKLTVGLQSSVERMQSKDLPKVAAEESTDIDDAAAHESTEPFDSAIKTNVPRDWTKQADLLHADRIRRTTSAKRFSVPRWTDDMNARKAAHAAQRAADEARAAEGLAKIRQEKQRLERERKLEKANEMLESEVKEQKFRMQAHENRYAHKVRSLRKELEMAYKQSTVHSEKHLERIRSLEGELERMQKAGGDAAKGLDTKKVQGESVVKATNWYEDIMRLRQDRLKGAERQRLEEGKKQDKALVSEIRDIYEKRYGIVDEQHRQPTLPLASEPKEKIVKGVMKATKKSEPKVVEVESDVDLGEALAKYEKEYEPYQSTRRDGVKEMERIVQKEEREANEGVKLVDDKMPKLIPTELAKPSSSTSAAPISSSSSARWTEPPVYKVLAYDSGNDIMSTATTTSNFTGTETPISIPEALSQLYQPARFVPHFAELQSEGYQVIYGSKDLLVLRKVNEVVAREAEAKPALEDHGLVAGEGHPDHWARFKETVKSDWNMLLNPIDGTAKTAQSAAVETEPSTGNFASPTGFVNHDPVVSKVTNDATPAAKSEQEATKPIRSEATEEVDQDVDWRHYPRVKREEYPVFTGTKRKWRNTDRAERLERRESRRKERERRREGGGSFVGRALGVGIVGASVAYLVGAAAEKSRKGTLGVVTHSGGMVGGREGRAQRLDDVERDRGRGW